MATPTAPYKTALRWPGLTRFYDAIMALTMRERSFRGAIIDQLEATTPSSILDVGCGTGTLLMMLRQALPEAMLFGVDGDETALQVARQKAEAVVGKPVWFKNGLATSLLFESASWDSVTCSLLFHHLSDADKRRAIDEMRRVLRPGGTVVVADWGPPANWLIGVLFTGLQLFDGFDTTAFNRRGQLPRLMEEAGFTNVRRARRVNTAFGTLDILRGERPL
jgi:ubiquinone/menaquinone biosynthesis C-methylase UbiE